MFIKENVPSMKKDLPLIIPNDCITTVNEIYRVTRKKATGAKSETVQKTSAT